MQKSLVILCSLYLTKKKQLFLWTQTPKMAKEIQKKVTHNAGMASVP